MASLVKFISAVDTYLPTVPTQFNIEEQNISQITGTNASTYIDVGHEFNSTGIGYAFGVDFDSNKEIDISWVPEPTVANTKIKLGSKYFGSVPNTSEPTFSTQAIPAGTYQIIKVEQYDASNVLISSTSEVFQAPPAHPRKLFMKPGTLTSTSFTVRWGSLGNIIKAISFIKIYVEKGGVTSVVTKTLNELTDENEFAVLNLISGTDYNVWISCVNAQGESVSSNKIKIRTM